MYFVEKLNQALDGPSGKHLRRKSIDMKQLVNSPVSYLRMILHGSSQTLKQWTEVPLQGPFLILEKGENSLVLMGFEIIGTQDQDASPKWE